MRTTSSVSYARAYREATKAKLSSRSKFDEDILIQANIGASVMSGKEDSPSKQGRFLCWTEK
jgi:hypothetical protein